MAIKPEEVLKAIAAARGNAICVPTMTTSPAWREIAPDDLSVGCVGFMGGASSMGAGLALARPERRVIVFDGDGSLLMQLGSLATIAGARPRNLVHLLFKNGVYHTSGSQDIPGGLTVDFVTMARGAGYKSAMAITTLEEFKRKLPGAADRRGADLRGAAHVTGRSDADDRAGRAVVPRSGRAAAVEAAGRALSYCVGIVSTGGGAFSPVSASVMRISRNVNVPLDRRSWSSIQYQRLR